MQTLYVKASSTPLPAYVCGGSTRPELRPAPRIQEPTNLVEWQGSEAAKAYEGEWVLLADDYQVKDHTHSPSELFRRNPDERCPRIVYVYPKDAAYVF